MMLKRTMVLVVTLFVIVAVYYSVTVIHDSVRGLQDRWDGRYHCLPGETYTTAECR